MQYCLHVLISTALAISFSRVMSDSIFESIIKMRSLPFLGEIRYLPKPLTAKDIMSKDITL